MMIGWLFVGGGALWRGDVSAVELCIC